MLNKLPLQQWAALPLCIRELHSVRFVTHMFASFSRSVHAVETTGRESNVYARRIYDAQEAVGRGGVRSSAKRPSAKGVSDHQRDAEM